MKSFCFVLITCFFLSSCENVKDYDISSERNYEKNKLSLEETEKKSPSTFIVVAGENKRNFLGQTVIKGIVTNNAKIVAFKDIEVKLSFFSKTGTLLEEDRETIYEAVSPGKTVKFKSKYFTPKGTDSVGFKVTGAKF